MVENPLTFDERERIVETLPYESRIGFMAFCAERCLNEARRYRVPREQLEQLPLLTEAVEMLWARAEQGVIPDPNRIKTVLEHIQYEQPHPSGEGVIYRHDITLVYAALVLMNAARMLQDANRLAPPYVVDGLEGPIMCVGTIYADWNAARSAELAVIDAALLRLREWGNKPFSRTVFADIPDWTRGELSRAYAEGRITSSLPDEDE